MPKSQRVAREIQKPFSGWTFSSQGSARFLITIDKLEAQNILIAKKEVAVSATLEGTISNPDLLVYLLVYDRRLRAYRTFPGVTDTQAESDGKYRWRALCEFGELSESGNGDLSNILAVGIDRTALIQGRLPEKLPTTTHLSAPIKRMK